MAIMENTL